MQGPVRALLLGLLVVMPAASPAQAPELIDRVVAVITPGGASEKRVVLALSELENEARIALIRAGGTEAASGPIPKETLAATLDHVIAQVLLAAEAEDLAVVTVEPADVAAELARFRSRFDSEQDYLAFLERFELTVPELERILRRGLVVERYLASRVRLSISITDADLRRAHERQGGSARGFEDARDELRRRVETERREELVEALVADLRARAQVRVVHDLGGRRRAADE